MALTLDALWEGRGLGGLKRTEIIQRAVRSREALFEAIRTLGHPHAAAFSSSNCEQLDQELSRWTRTWVDFYPWTPKPKPIDVALLGLLRADISAELRHRLFGGVPLESDLTEPCVRWLRNEGYEVAAEVPVGGSRADLVGYKSGFLGRDIVIVELKNAASEVERLGEQLRDYVRAADTVRVVMTPECLAEVSLARDELAAPLAYLKPIEKMGSEAWLYDSTAQRFEQLGYSVMGSYEGARYDEIWQYLVASVEAA